MLFVKAFKKFSGKKNLNEFVKNQEYFIEPKQISLGFDPTTQKEDTIQYVPIYSTLNAVLRHEDVLAHIYAETSPQNGVIKTFRDSLGFKSNTFLNSREHVLEICLYHDEFSIVNSLGNKTHKHKISAFYFVLGNLPPKFKSRLKDIHLVILSPANFVSKYGCNSILSLLLEDLKKLENEGISVNFQGVLHRFKGTVTMIIADNLAAHALGGFFCNFSTVQRFCRFCNSRKSQITFALRTKNAYENNLRAVLEDPNLAVLYGIKDSSPLNTSSYFHAADGLPPDLCHDLFEGFAVDVISNVIIDCIKDSFF